MADARGRARGRGRARAQPQRVPPGPPQQPQRAPAGPPQQPQRGAWGPPVPQNTSAGPQQPPTAWGPSKTQNAPAGQTAGQPAGQDSHRSAGRASDETRAAAVTQTLGRMTIGGNGGGGDGSGVPSGRGNMRGGRRIVVNTVTTRPQALTSKQGTSGDMLKLQANYFSLVTQTDWCLYQYRVDFAPAIDLIIERKKLLRVQKKNIKGEFIFDGTVMYCSHRLEVDPMELFSARESDNSQIRITIKLVGQMLPGDGHYLQFFNILTRTCLKYLNLKLIHRDYYDELAKVKLDQHSLELWPGYRTVINQHEQSVLMCTEITHKVMRTKTCLDLMAQLATSTRDYREAFMKAVLGTVVLTDYNNRTYSISAVDWGKTPMTTFQWNGRTISFIQYYREKYNITIKDQKQPLLVSRSKPRDIKALKLGAVEQAGDGNHDLINLIPELCRMTGLTDDMRSNFTLMRDMADITRISSEERQKRLMEMNRRLRGEERIQKEFTSWNMQLSNKLVEVPGRKLKSETIWFGENHKEVVGPECDWTRSLRSVPMFVMPQDGLQRWVVLFPKRLGAEVDIFVKNLQQAAKGMRFMIASPVYEDMSDDRTQTYVDKLDKIISTKQPQLIFVVVTNAKADRYSAIKKKTLIDRAVPTQVLCGKNLDKKGGGGMSIATKVAIQINCKIGGAPWAIDNPLKGMMVIGFDVCHDPKSKGKSYGAMVASLNKTLTRYYSTVSHHSTGQELSDDLAINVMKALHCYRKHNDTLPSHIIIYRDGVGDGQIPYVFGHEVDRVNRSIRELYTTGSPKMAFILVCKRINTRLFLGKRNPPPGTVVDDVITLPERYDFFLISQHVTQGTVTPTSYNVIHDTLGLDPDKIQRLTYKMTHGYYNWSGTVRVPAPVQYAHKLAFLVGQSLHRPPNPGLEDLLYFL